MALISPYGPTYESTLNVLGTYLYGKYLPAYNELGVLLSSGEFVISNREEFVISHTKTGNFSFRFVISSIRYG